MNVKGFNHVTIRVSDLQRSLAFYRDVLAMKVVHAGKRDTYLEWGTAWICLVETDTTAPSSLETETDTTAPSSLKTTGVDHVAFSIDEEEFDEAVETLRRAGVTIVRGPVRRGLGRSVNFLDPDGTQLELHTSDLAARMTVWK